MRINRNIVASFLIGGVSGAVGYHFYNNARVHRQAVSQLKKQLMATPLELRQSTIDNVLTAASQMPARERAKVQAIIMEVLQAVPLPALE